MTEEELKEMSQGGIPIPQGSNLQPAQPQSFQYFRRCPTCGHLEAVNTPVVQPFLQTPQPVRSSPQKISVLNNGQTLEDGGVEAEWR